MVPEHVLTAFQSDTAEAPQQLGPEWGNGDRVGTVVYAESTDTSHWSGTVRDKLDVPGLRISRPILSSDGRTVVAGWTADTFIDGAPQLRIDETVSAALRLTDALWQVQGPVGLQRDDDFAIAEREAWAECDERYGEIDAPGQVGHADMVGTTIYDGTRTPGLTDVVPFVVPRPYAMTAATAIADLLILAPGDTVDDSVVSRFGHVPDLKRLVLRALAYRRHVAERHEFAPSNAVSNIHRIEETLVSRWSDTI